MLTDKNEEITQQKQLLIDQAIILEKEQKNLQELNNSLTEKNQLIENKNIVITSSINYAQRIQKAILTAVAPSRDYLTDFFIMYQPKDIVSGDFYFAKKINQHIIIALADCTGHGVPGALLSTMGIAFLNEIVRDNTVKTAGRALDILRSKIETTLGQQGKIFEHKDGMDMSLIVLNTDTYNIQFAGAFHSLHIARSGKLFEIKGDRMPIGIYIKETPFRNHIYQVEKNDCIYMFTDGYADQTGGEKGRKLLLSRLKELILDGSNMSMEQQKINLENYLSDWMGNEYKQIDDISILGFKI